MASPWWPGAAGVGQLLEVEPGTAAAGFADGDRRCWPAPGQDPLQLQVRGLANCSRLPDPPAAISAAGQHLVVATCRRSGTWPVAKGRPGRRGFPAGAGGVGQHLVVATCSSSRSARAPRIHRPAPAALAIIWWCHLQQVRELASCSTAIGYLGRAQNACLLEGILLANRRA